MLACRAEQGPGRPARPRTPHRLSRPRPFPASPQPLAASVVTTAPYKTRRPFGLEWAKGEVSVFLKTTSLANSKSNNNTNFSSFPLLLKNVISLNYVSSRAAGNAKPCLFVCSFVCLFVLELTGREWTGDRASAGRLSWPLLVGLGFCFSMTRATAVQSGGRIKGKD